MKQINEGFNKLFKSILNEDLPEDGNYDKYEAIIEDDCDALWDKSEVYSLFDSVWNKVSPDYKIVLVASSDFPYGNLIFYLLPEEDWNDIYDFDGDYTFDTDGSELELNGYKWVSIVSGSEGNVSSGYIVAYGQGPHNATMVDSDCENELNEEALADRIAQLLLQ